VRSTPGRKVLIALLTVLAVAAVLRAVDLENLPPGLFVDEAFTGYDAYSLSLTGRDMWGERLPIFFRSWGDYNSGLYRYLSVPWVATLGLSAASVRAAAALAGVLTVLAAFILGRRLFSARVGLVAAALLAVSPWHLQFSRIAFRGILLPLLLTLAALAFIRAVEKKGAWPLLAAGAFGLSLYTYSPARIVVPLMLVVMLVLYRRELSWSWPVVGASVVLLAVLSVPLASITLGGEGQERYAIMSILETDAGGRAGPVEVLSVFARNYVSHFSPRFLLVSGDINLRHSVSGVGQLNWGAFVLLIVGVVVAAVRRTKAHVLLLLWVLVAPIPGSLTTDNVPNALRCIGMLPAAQLLAGLGLFELLDGKLAERLRSVRLRPAVVVGAVALLFALGAVRSTAAYFTRYRTEAAPWWDYGYREAVSYAEGDGRRFDRVAIVAPDVASMRAYANNPYAFIFPLFYTARDPAELHRDRDRHSGRYGVLNAPGGGPVIDDMLMPGILYVVRATQAEIAAPLHVVTYPSGEPAFVLATGEGRAPAGR
jgi:4-amino-4-deoxy-L-arabinose transferase-like glycosyltransferase